MNTNNLPPHASPEMAKIIVEVESAKFKDNSDLDTWMKNRQKAREIWEKTPELEKQQAIREGRAFTETNKVPSGKWVRVIRRKLRYKIFRLREGKWQHDKELAALKAWYELQFQSGWHWTDFTFKWDLSAKDPLKIITQIEWDGDVVSEKTGGGNLGKFCDPAAFTNQEI